MVCNPQRLHSFFSLKPSAFVPVAFRGHEGYRRLFPGMGQARIKTNLLLNMVTNPKERSKTCYHLSNAWTLALNAWYQFRPIRFNLGIFCSAPDHELGVGLGVMCPAFFLEKILQSMI